MVFWDETPCSLVKGYYISEGTYYLGIDGRRVPEDGRSRLFRNVGARCQISEDCDLFFL
jgi:hypothetical protein